MRLARGTQQAATAMSRRWRRPYDETCYWYGFTVLHKEILGGFSRLTEAYTRVCARGGREGEGRLLDRCDLVAESKDMMIPVHS